MILPLIRQLPQELLWHRGQPSEKHRPRVFLGMGSYTDEGHAKKHSICCGDNFLIRPLALFAVCLVVCNVTASWAKMLASSKESAIKSTFIL